MAFALLSCLYLDPQSLSHLIFSTSVLMKRRLIESLGGPLVSSQGQASMISKSILRTCSSLICLKQSRRHLACFEVWIESMWWLLRQRLCATHGIVFTSIKTFLSKPGKSHHSERALPQACAHPRMLFLGCPKSFFLFYPFFCQSWKQKHKHRSQLTCNASFFVTVPSWVLTPWQKTPQKPETHFFFFVQKCHTPSCKAMCHEQNITGFCSNMCQNRFSY